MTTPPIEASDTAELLRLLDLANECASWGWQMYSHFKDEPGGRHFFPKLSTYYKARVEFFAPRRPLGHGDHVGCVGCKHTKRPEGGYDWEIREDCAYHQAAAAQPWNHRIPWNCPSYHDGCNCEGGPLYTPPAGTFPGGFHRIEGRR